MIRILYSWRVKPGSEEAFVRAWTRGTCTIRETVRGANGSLLFVAACNRNGPGLQ